MFALKIKEILNCIILQIESYKDFYNFSLINQYIGKICINKNIQKELKNKFPVLRFECYCYGENVYIGMLYQDNNKFFPCDLVGLDYTNKNIEIFNVENHDILQYAMNGGQIQILKIFPFDRYRIDFPDYKDILSSF